MRISVLGQGGCGKTYLAKKLHEKYGIPVIHLDRIWIKYGGHKPKQVDSRDRERRKMKREVEELVKRPAWVSEGFYKRLEPMITGRADMVIHLPRPLVVRVLNHLSRTIRGTHRHKEISWYGDIAHSVTLVKKSAAQKKQLRTLLNLFNDKTIHLRSRKEVKAFLDWLPDDIDELRHRHRRSV